MPVRIQQFKLFSAAVTTLDRAGLTASGNDLFTNSAHTFDKEIECGLVIAGGDLYRIGYFAGWRNDHLGVAQADVEPLAPAAVIDMLNHLKAEDTLVKLKGARKIRTQ